MVDIQPAFDMVALMLDTGRLQAMSLELVSFPVQILRPHADVIDTRTSRLALTRYGKAAFVELHRLAQALVLRVDQYPLGVVFHLHDRQAQVNPDLHRSEPDALRVTHRFEHIRNQLSQLVVELRNRFGRDPQARIGMMHNWPDHTKPLDDNAVTPVHRVRLNSYYKPRAHSGRKPAWAGCAIATRTWSSMRCLSAPKTPFNTR